MDHTKVPPSNQEAEWAVLGSVLLDKKALTAVARIVKVDDFYWDAHKTIFKAMLEIQAGMGAVDLLTLANKLDEEQKIDSVGGSGYLAQMMNNTPTATNVAHYAKIVKKHSTARQLIVAGHKIIELGQAIPEEKEGIAEASKTILDIHAQKDTESHAVGEILNEYEALQEQYAEAAKNGKSILGDTTGFLRLDEMTQGFREHHLWLIGGYTSVGKTYFALNLVRWLLEQDKRIVFYSLEMSKVDIISRLMAILTEMPPQYILRGLMTADEKFRYDIAKSFLAQCKLTIYSDMHNLDELKFSMIEESMKEPVGVYFLDYVQLVTRTGDEYKDMRAAATELQALMGQLKSPLVMLSQLSNEAVKSPKSLVSGFKGAGNLAQAADYGIELWPGEKDMDVFNENKSKGIPVRVKLNLKKNRQGRTGVVDMKFSSYTGVFEEEGKLTS